MLDRTKEPGSIGEPLFLDVVAALPRRPATARAVLPRVVGGRYGLSSKEFTPGMVAGVFDGARARAAAAPVHDRHRRRRLRHEPDLRRVAGHRAARHGPRRVLRAGRGRDGRREQEHDQDPRLRGDLHAQGYFVYDSKKSGSQTVSHLRFGPRPIRAPYLVQQRGVRRLSPVRAARQGGRARPRRRPARRCCSTAGTRRTRSGTRCRGPSRSRSSRRASRST